MPKANEALKEEWKKRLEQWRASGLNGTTWCRENQIAPHVFLYWRRKLKDYPIKDISGIASNFIELSDKAQSIAGIIIEYRGITIRLSKDFDEATLMKCLKVLRDLPC